MALLKFNKSELVNLAYSLKREIICTNKTGAYCNTSIVTCNTRRYHSLLAVTLERFGSDRYSLLSSVDESIMVNGKQFNLGIHCYGGTYEPKGHKYVVDFNADSVPELTYQVGDVLLRKTLFLVQDKDQLLIKYELLQAPSAVRLMLKPFLSFRNVHALTHRNDSADLRGTGIANGISYKMYENFPDLCMQLSDSGVSFTEQPAWYNNITYTDEERRGFECSEDLFVPGFFEMTLKPGASVVFSAATIEQNPASLKRAFTLGSKAVAQIGSFKDQLRRCAESLISDQKGQKKITSGYSWLYTGLLRETLLALPGLTLYGLGDTKLFEKILDNLIAEEQDRLFRRTTQVEAPFLLANDLQHYIAFGANEGAVWRKYGATLKGILESYLPGGRQEIVMHPNGLLWAQKESTALSWMNAYVNGQPVTERAGYQVETNALWYNAICFAVEMEGKYGLKRDGFVKKWAPVVENIRANYQSTFWNDSIACLADHVDNSGQHLEVRPNQLCAVANKYIPIDESLIPLIIKVVERELLTSRGVRTLSPRDSRYKGVYEGSQHERDLAYHQGSTRPYLLEPYIAAGFLVNGASFVKKAESLVEGFYADLNKHGVGAFSELYDGDPPHEPHGAISSALSTAALLTVEYIIDKYKEAEK